MAAENLFLRKQLALFQERKVKPRRSDDATRWMMATLSEQPKSFALPADEGIRLHKRRRLPKDLRQLIQQMAADNPIWGQQCIANELKLKLGIRVSPRTVGKYLRHGTGRTLDPKQRWLTFVRDHAKVMVAGDFFVVVTVTFRTLVRIRDPGAGNTTNSAPQRHRSPHGGWTLQQFREAVPGDHPYRYVIHDRDSIFSKRLDRDVTNLGVRALRMRVRAPMGNARCERLGGILRRECLDFLIPLTERHLKLTIKEWRLHYNRVGRTPRSVLDFRSQTMRAFWPATTDTSCLLKSV